MSSVEKNTLPEGWEEKSLIEISSVKTGKHDANHSCENGLYRFYTCAFNHLYCNTKRFSGECIILPGNGANVGQVFFYNGDFDAYQRTYVIYDIKILPYFLYYHLKSEWRKKGVEKQYGSATNFIKIGNFNDYTIPIPPLEEQKRIVAKIDGLFAKIDKAISLTEESLTHAKNLLPSVLNEVFDSLSIENENVELSNICTFKNGYAFKSKEFNKTGEGKQVIRIGNVLDVQKNQVFIKESLSYNAHLLNKNDIIISMTGTRNKKDYLFVRIIKDESSYLNQRVGKISVNSITHHSYIYYYLKSDMFRSKVFEYETGAVNQGNISGKAIMNMLIPKVDFEKQIEIGCICSDLSEKAEQTQSKLVEQLTYLKQLKSSILSKAFKGEL
jgi:type I restriction enzyme S subunit